MSAAVAFAFAFAFAVAFAFDSRKGKRNSNGAGQECPAYTQLGLRVAPPTVDTKKHKS
jgi:hypothetical protein